MKIGIVTEYYYPSLGGITEHVHHFATEAKKLGHNPVIITGDAGNDPYANTKEFEIVRIGKSLPIYSNGSIARVSFGAFIGKKLRELFASEKFDIIHIHSPFVPTLPLSSQRYSKTTTVATFHTQFDSSFFLRAFKNLFQTYFDNLHGKIAVSQLCIDSMSRYFTGKYRIIPNGIDTTKFNPDSEKIERFTDGKLNIFFLSRLEPRNGLEYMIQAFVKIRQERNDVRLIIGGDGPFKRHFMSMVPSRLKNDVHFLGRINGSRPNYYATADVFCFPTTKASFGITLLEGMSAAKPVIAFSIPAFKTIITNQKDGILCGAPGVDNLASAINELLDSPEKRAKIGQAARVRAEDFSWERITKEIISYYHEIKSIY